MMLGGDELSHGQKGNNNTYCQDNELTWLDWNLDERKQRFLEFTKKLLFIRMTQPVFQRRKFFIGRSIRGSNVKDISFFSPSGEEMSDGDWDAGFVKCLGIRLAGDLINDETERGEPIVGDTLLILLNGHWEPISFTLPSTLHGHVWERLLDTAETSPTAAALEGSNEYPLQDRSLVVLVTRKPEDTGQTVTSTEAKAAVSGAKGTAQTVPGPSPI
jgi:isoamylase